MPFYTGVGSRSAPPEVLARVTLIARSLDQLGWTLRSGGAVGVDQAFEAGAVRMRPEIYIPWQGFRNRYVGPYDPPAILLSSEDFRLAEERVSQVHPTWEKCGPSAQTLHARNAFQVFGSLTVPAEPSRFVLCWTQDGAVKGGTATAIRLAQNAGIPVFNLGSPDNPIAMMARLLTLLVSQQRLPEEGSPATIAGRMTDAINTLAELGGVPYRITAPRKLGLYPPPREKEDDD